MDKVLRVGGRWLVSRRSAALQRVPLTRCIDRVAGVLLLTIPDVLFSFWAILFQTKVGKNKICVNAFELYPFAARYIALLTRVPTLHRTPKSLNKQLKILSKQDPKWNNEISF